MADANPTFSERCRRYRRQILEVMRTTGRGHMGSALSIVEIVATLYDEVLRYDPADPRGSGRDRFILSKGHGCLAHYVVLADKGFFAEEHLWKVSADGAILGGHPESELTPGVEASTGSLGHGLSIGVGMALAAQMDGRDYRTYVLLGDGECDEGSVWEAAMSAAQHRLSNLAAIVDYNKMQCYVQTAEVLDLEPFAAKWESFGFAVQEADGHDHAQLRRALAAMPLDADKPNVLICHTVKGKGVPEMEQNPAWHHRTRVPGEELQRLMDTIDDGVRPPQASGDR